MSELFASLPFGVLSDAVVLSIRDALTSGHLKPGQRLLEVEIARQMGISRAPVREALRQLEQEGLVVSRPHRGTFVATLSPTDAREVYSLRAALEGQAAFLVCHSATDAQLNELLTLAQAMLPPAQANDLLGLIEQDLHFHQRFLELAGQKRLLDTWLSIATQVRAFIAVTHRIYLPLVEIAERHLAFAQTLARRDAETARSLIVQDIMEVGEHVAAGLAASQPAANHT